MEHTDSVIYKERGLNSFKVEWKFEFPIGVVKEGFIDSILAQSKKATPWALIEEKVDSSLKYRIT
jgi:hypothetical protein